MDASIKAQCKQFLEKAKESIRISVWKDDFEEYSPTLLKKERAGIEVEAVVVGSVEAKLTHLYILSPNEEHRTLE